LGRCGRTHEGLSCDLGGENAVGKGWCGGVQYTCQDSLRYDIGVVVYQETSH